MKYCVDTGNYTKPENIIQGYSTQTLCKSNGTYTPGAASYCQIGPMRVLDEDKTVKEKELFQGWFDEQLTQYGMEVHYYVYNYSLSSHDYIYGEDVLATYSTPIKMIMAVQLSTESLLFSKYGIAADADFTGMVSYTTFTRSTSATYDNLEPKAGDLVYLSEFGAERPNGRSGKVFEITERKDQNSGTSINQLQGHYLWLIKAKRYDYSFLPNSPKEKLINQIYDSMVYFEQTTGTLPSEGITLNTYTSLLSTGVAGNTQNTNANLSSAPLSSDYTPLTGSDLGIGCNPGPLRFLDKNRNKNERNLFENWWIDQTNFYGIKVEYHIDNTRLSATDVYGEDVLQIFSNPITMIMLVELGADNLILSRFGIQSDADFTAIIPIQTFYSYTSAFGANLEPKAGDLIRLYEYGKSRIGGRDGQIFEITERTDENPTSTNQLMGHYTWTIKAKRFDFTYEKNSPVEAKINQVYDNDLTQNANTDKTYTQGVSATSKNIFDYDAYPKSKDSVYGDY